MPADRREVCNVDASSGWSDPSTPAPLQASPRRRLGAIEVTTMEADRSKVVQGDSHFVVLGTEPRDEHGQGLAEQHLGFLVAAEPVDDRRQRGAIRRDGEVIVAECGDPQGNPWRANCSAEVRSPPACLTPPRLCQTAATSGCSRPRAASSTTRTCQ